MHLRDNMMLLLVLLLLLPMLLLLLLLMLLLLMTIMMSTQQLQHQHPNAARIKPETPPPACSTCSNTSVSCIPNTRRRDASSTTPTRFKQPQLPRTSLRGQPADPAVGLSPQPGSPRCTPS